MTQCTISGSFTNIMKNVKDLLGHEEWDITIYPNKRVLTVYTPRPVITLEDLSFYQPLVMYFQEVKIAVRPNINKFCNKYKPKKIDSVTGECCICYDTLIDQNVIELNCHHVYHENCIKDWVKCDKENSLECPYCRQEITL